MLIAERTLGAIDAPKIQIFATDIDEAAIAIAREGYYTINDAADLSPERLRRFFNKEGDGYRIRREIREMLLFASHNFLKDPPFSHLMAKEAGAEDSIAKPFSLKMLRAMIGKYTS